MFRMHININKLPDSMCYDSGTTICTYINEDDRIIIEVRGHVTVSFKGETYRHYSEMPEELQELFTSNDAYSDERVDIQENNWYEIFLNDDEEYDVAEVDGYTPKELEQYCKKCLKLFKGEA